MLHAVATCYVPNFREFRMLHNQGDQVTLKPDSPGQGCCIKMLHNRVTGYPFRPIAPVPSHRRGPPHIQDDTERGNQERGNHVVSLAPHPQLCCIKVAHWSTCRPIAPVRLDRGYRLFTLLVKKMCRAADAPYTLTGLTCSRHHVDEEHKPRAVHSIHRIGWRPNPGVQSESDADL